MFQKKLGRKSEHVSPMMRFFRSIFLVVVLSAFVLSISFVVKFLATTSSDKYITLLYNTSAPVMAKLNIDQSKAGQVAGDFVKRFTQTGAVDTEQNIVATAGTNSMEPSVDDQGAATSERLDPNFIPKVSVLVLADVHNEFDNLQKALALGKSRKITTAFFLGDYTDFGVIPDLQRAKSVMDASGFDYYSLPGDHDLWQSVGPSNFLEVFPKDNFIAYVGGFKFVGLNNSANYTLIESAVLDKFKKDIQDADFVFLSQPLYHPTFQRVMGVVNGEEQPEMKAQAAEILSIIRNTNVKAILAGDRHVSSNNSDPEKASLQHIVIGALTDVLNLQVTPRFSILKIDQDGNYQVEEVVLE